MRQLQQGDVLLQEIKALPEGVTPVKPRNDGRHILAEGEEHGHAHAIKDLDSVDLYDLNGILYLNVKSPTPLVHEEHNTINLPVGLFEVGQVVEVDPFEQEIHRVRD